MQASAKRAEQGNVRTIALYLPQYHPVPENDLWWGKGFTEWTNVARARPFFPGHYQPHVPADLGFYDLRLSESRIAQAEMASAYGVDAFCYYHYWFAGRRLLERPFHEVLASGKPDFPFCLCWANQTWAGVWHGAPNQTLIEQTYPGEEDHRRHFESLLPAFLDKRYFRVDGKPLFVIYNPLGLPHPQQTLELWRKLASQAGLPGLQLLAEHDNPNWPAGKLGFDGIINVRNLPKRRDWVPWADPIKKIQGKLLDIRGMPTVVEFSKLASYFVPEVDTSELIYPCVIPNWDNTPRSGSRGLVIHGSTPELFKIQLQRALAAVSVNKPQDQIIFIKSWNEWAEGNHLEPDQKNGLGYLTVLRDTIKGQGKVT